MIVLTEAHQRKRMAQFWSNVNIGAANACWNWKASTHLFGYGQFCWQGKNTGAHRIAWQLAKGPIPAGLGVLHMCDNSACCNPSHLFLGTQADNCMDRHQKGRSKAPRGTGNARAKLTEDDVHFIRMWVALGYSQQAVANAFGVKNPAVCKIVNRKNWRHVI